MFSWFISILLSLSIFSDTATNGNSSTPKKTDHSQTTIATTNTGSSSGARGVILTDLVIK